jgi:hypothetical protein
MSAALNLLSSHRTVAVGNAVARALYRQAKQDRVEGQFPKFTPPLPGATGVTYNGGRDLAAFLSNGGDKGPQGARTTEFQRGYIANFLYNVQHAHD